MEPDEISQIYCSAIIQNNLINILEQTIRIFPILCYI